ncbi:DHA2 family efflux MFS transporter permease subunit [Aeromicrobium duanguangcaii]|uniref:DHA2 family efflux MFS transporter permease subunit n=1 Tax=Aeromicrobium duanguangcaii TaxID=2968086 RepID=A0ABY5KH87_9ACTN|nr:DHA2 family efflux MFS transporter permease subunit [Aeromicrobium duanguangcaii]MCD9154111.1 DHA2 family efflux MFS transporter permease subunit [Aeromicrobium duanguangcaii]UUI68816.1 DHA2 family efflux MFS transporter permease subunit [Aeromicrobium duanguangcaii]
MSTSPPEGAAVDDDRITADILKIAGVVVLGAIMSILDVTVVNVALPTFQTELSSTDEPLKYATVAWTATAYMLALAAVIPLTGWAADRFGTKRLYMAAIGLFTLGSVLCATAWNIEALIGFRVLQGLGGGMLMPLGMTILTRAAGPHRMGRLMAILGIPMLLGPIMGPILGGVLIDSASWHWVFLINVPIGIVGLVYASRVLPKDAPEPSESLDRVGLLLMSPGLALLLYGISSIPGEGTALAAKVIVPAVIGLALIAAFVVWSFKPKHPLLDLRLLGNRNLRVSLIVMFLFASAFFGALLLVPTYFQQVRGESVLMAGLLVAPQGIGAMLTMPIAGALVDRIPVGRIVPFGFLGILVGMLGLAQSTDPGTPYWHIIGWLFVMGLGMGGTMMPIFTSALKTLTSHEVARGSTLLNVVQQVASASGIAVISVVLTNGMQRGSVIPGSDKIPNVDGGLTPAQLASQSHTDQGGQLVQMLGVTPAQLQDGFSDLAHAFAQSYWVAFAVLVVTLIPVAFLPRKKEPARLLDDKDQPPAMMH